MKKVGVGIIASLAWTNYWKVRSHGRMERQYGPLLSEKEMMEHEEAPAGAHKQLK